MNYAWDWQVIWQYKEAFVYGLWMTVWISALTIVAGTFLGAALVALQSRNFIMRGLAFCYIEVFRAVPILVLLFWVHYGLPMMTGVHTSAFTSALIALSLNLAGFTAENIRAGLESVPITQRESAAALGMSQWQITRQIIVPQAIRNMLPNLMGIWITCIKLTSMASVIGVSELLNRGGSIISLTYQPFEVYTALAVMYLIIILPLSFIARAYEKRLAAREGE